MIGLAALAMFSVPQAEASEVTWTKDVKPLFEKQCQACHGATSPDHGEFDKDKKGWAAKGIGMRMDTHTHLASHVGWPYTGALMRRLDDGASKTDKNRGTCTNTLEQRRRSGRPISLSSKTGLAPGIRNAGRISQKMN